MLVSLFWPLLYPRYFLFAGLALPLVIAMALEGVSTRSKSAFVIGLSAVILLELNGLWHVYNKTCTWCYENNQLGALAARPGQPLDDGCRASCVDWYGNARPLFLQGRVFALLGYELVEGALREGQIREVRRISYAPAAR